MYIHLRKLNREIERAIAKSVIVMAQDLLNRYLRQMLTI